MALLEVEEKIKRQQIDKKITKRQLRIEYAKGTLLVLVFLTGLALVSNLNNIYFAVKYGFNTFERPWYSNFVAIISMLAYLALFVSVYRLLGFKVTDKIDDLKTMIDSYD